MEKCGLFVHPDFPFLGATPDGLFGDDSVIEVKCPYTGRNSKIVPGKMFPFLAQDGSAVVMKKSHKYYYQVMGQLAISKRKLCYFVVYTMIDFLVIEVNYEDEFFRAEMLPKLKSFYVSHFRSYVASTL